MWRCSASTRETVGSLIPPFRRRSCGLTRHFRRFPGVSSRRVSCGAPPILPLARAWARPVVVLSRIMARSNSAKEPTYHLASYGKFLKGFMMSAHRAAAAKGLSSTRRGASCVRRPPEHRLLLVGGLICLPQLTLRKLARACRAQLPAARPRRRPHPHEEFSGAPGAHRTRTAGGATARAGKPRHSRGWARRHTRHPVPASQSRLVRFCAAIAASLPNGSVRARPPTASLPIGPSTYTTLRIAAGARSV